MFQKWRQPLIFAGCVWALLAFAAAQSSSTCGAFFTVDCLRLGWQRLGHIVLLEWVKDYQALLAGIAALVAGAFVLLSTRMQIKAVEDRDRKKDSSALSANLYEAFQKLLDLIVAVTAENPDIHTYCQNVNSLIPHVNRCSPRLGTDITRIIQYILHVQEIDRKLASARLQISVYIVATMANHLEKNPLSPVPIPLDEIKLGRQYIDRVASDFGVELAKLERFHVFFDMENANS